MKSIFKKAAPEVIVDDRSVMKIMIQDPCKLKGDEILLCYLPPLRWIYQGSDGELIFLYHSGAPYGCYVRASESLAASLKRRYETRALLKQGDLISARIIVEGEAEKNKPIKYDSVIENCRFESFADAEKRFAWVIRFDGSRCKTGDFEAFIFDKFEPLWTKVNGRWIVGYYSRTVSAEEVELNFYEGGPGNCGFILSRVKIADIRARDESVIPAVGDLVTALIGDIWLECILVGGTLGHFIVKTKYLRRTKTATLIQPSERTFAEKAA